MAKNIVTNRKYRALIVMLIVLVVFMIIRNNFLNSFNEKYNEISVVLNNYGSFENTINARNAIIEPLYRDIESLKFNFSLVIIFFNILSFFMFFDKYKTKEKKIILFLTFAGIAWLTLEISKTIGYLSFRMSGKDEYFITLLFLFPYLYFIFQDSIIGIKEDKTEEIKTENNNKHEDNLNDLDRLLEMDLISIDEYNQKKESRVKDKIRIETKDSEEYSLLLKAKQKGLLSEEEFNNKVESLVLKKYSSILN